MPDQIREFCNLVRFRSKENQVAMTALSQTQFTVGPMMSILRQELDSMIRVIYLLSIIDLEERKRLIRSTLEGEKWMINTAKGKKRIVTDRDMVDLAQRLHGWAQSVYKFGCSFIHLSDFHNYSNTNPLDKLPHDEQRNIIDHMRYYHGGPRSDSPDMDELSKYFPSVLDKISGNLESYLCDLEEGKSL